MRRYPPTQGRSWRGRPNGGSTRAWRTQRASVLARDGHQCTAILRTGERCPVHAPARLEIHHMIAGHGIEAPDHLLATRCPKHNPRGPQ